MHPQIERLFDEAEDRYLKPEELSVLTDYVESLPQRLEFYQQVRDRELDIMQPVADQLNAALPNENIKELERSVKNAILLLRYCAMAMLLNDERFVQDRLLNWLSQLAKTRKSQRIDAVLLDLLDAQLKQMFSANQLAMIQPSLALARDTLLDQSPSPAKV